MVLRPVSGNRALAVVALPDGRRLTDSPAATQGECLGDTPVGATSAVGISEEAVGISAAMEAAAISVVADMAEATAVGVIGKWRAKGPGPSRSGPSALRVPRVENQIVRKRQRWVHF